MWRHLVAPLVAKGYRVWAVNQRGYGATSRPQAREDYSLEALTGDVAALIDASGARAVALIGHDWGGMIAWVVAIRRLRPLERLIVVNIPHPLCFKAALRGLRQKVKSLYAAFFQIPLLPDLLLSAGRGYLTGRLIRMSSGRPAAIPAAVMDIYRENIAAPGAATAMLNWYRRAAPDLFNARDLDVPVETPVLIVWGTDDVALGEHCLEGTERYVRRFADQALAGREPLLARGFAGQARRTRGEFPFRAAFGVIMTAKLNSAVDLPGFRGNLPTSEIPPESDFERACRWATI